MVISDNIIRERLKNVYWIIGTSCAGKSTMAKAIAEKYDMLNYETNDQYSRFIELASDADQPYLSRKFRDAEEYFSQPLLQYAEQIEKSTEEAFEMIVTDFLGMDPNRPIITETVHILDLVVPITDYNHLAFLFVREELFRKQNWDRDDEERRGLLSYMHTTGDPEKHMNHVTEMGVITGKRMIENAKKLKVAMFERTESTTVEEMMVRLETHFQLN